MPDRVDVPKVALVNKRIEIKPFEQLAKGEGPFPARWNITEGGQLPRFKSEERAMRARIVERGKSSGANVLVCRSRIEERGSDKLSREGIFAIQMGGQRDLDEIARGTGATMRGSVSP